MNEEELKQLKERNASRRGLEIKHGKVGFADN